MVHTSTTPATTACVAVKDLHVQLPTGIELQARTWGDADTGVPLLLIPGSGATFNFYDPLAHVLARYGVYCISADHRDSFQRPVCGTYTFDEMTDDWAGLLDHLGLPRAHVLGHSMGGQLAQNFAVRHGARLLSLTLASTCAGESLAAKLVGMRRSPTRFARILWMLNFGLPRESTTADEYAAFVSKFYTLTMAPTDAYSGPFGLLSGTRSKGAGGATGYCAPLPPADRAALAAQAAAEFCRGAVDVGGHQFERNNNAQGDWEATAVRGGDVARGLAALRVPALVLVGDRDLLCPVWAAEELAAALPLAGAAVETYSGGHGLPAGELGQIARTVCAHVGVPLPGIRRYE